jgi:hypothetical protein
MVPEKAAKLLGVRDDLSAAEYVASTKANPPTLEVRFYPL